MMKMDEIKRNSFTFWKTQEVEEIFGIKKVEQLDGLNDWLAVTEGIDPVVKVELNKLQRRLIKKVNDWSMPTLSFHFTKPLINLVDLNRDNYNSFAQTAYELTVNQETIRGKIDFLVATGYQIPVTSFLILNEYRPTSEVRNDPQGQLLMMMLAAQQRNVKNGNDLPLYGIYIMERLFFFVHLHKKQFVTSLAYDATKDDLYSIFNILKKTKGYIDKTVKQLEETAMI